MSNELNNIISRSTDGVYEGVAIGGDRYPGTTFIDHIIRFHDDPNVKMIVLLGEVSKTALLSIFITCCIRWVELRNTLSVRS